jgi:hypothetical protein
LFQIHQKGLNEKKVPERAERLGAEAWTSSVLAFSRDWTRLLHFSITNQITPRQITAPIVDARAITAIFALLIL